MMIKNHFHKEGFALGLVLKQRLVASPKWTIEALIFTLSRFCHKVATRTIFVHPEILPQTSSAATFYSNRVYFQIKQWKGILQQPEDWRPVHESLLEFIRCKCKTDCSTHHCMCRSLYCSSLCGESKDHSFANPAPPDMVPDVDKDLWLIF